MSKSKLKNQIRYIIANEQYLKPLLEQGRISEEVYNETLESLYDEYAVWQTGTIVNPKIQVHKRKREAKRTLSGEHPGYISLTELAKLDSDKTTGYTVQSWLRDNNTISYLSLWEQKYNEKFLPLIKTQGKTITPKNWIENTNAIGIVSRQGKNGATYAHRVIATHFMCWLSPEMMLNVIEKYVGGLENEENN